MLSRQSMGSFWAILLLFFGLLAPAAAQRWGDGGYDIVRAEYGTHERSVDVTPRVRDLMRWNRPFIASNDTFDIDPHPKREKTLRIHTRAPGGGVQVFEFAEGSSVSASMFANPGYGARPGQGGGYGGGYGGGGRYSGEAGSYQVQQATWGTAERSVDVTQNFVQLLHYNRTFTVNNEGLGADPHRGQTKVLRVWARSRDGQQRMFEFVEGSVVDGALFANRGGGRWNDGWGAQPQPLPQPQPGYGGGGYLQILRATYGAGDRHIDVTENLRSRVRGNRLETRVDNEMAGYDPTPNVPKVLWVTYSVGGREQQVQVRESGYLRLP